MNLNENLSFEAIRMDRGFISTVPARKLLRRRMRVKKDRRRYRQEDGWE
jgi:hypothetical protein